MNIQDFEKLIIDEIKKVVEKIIIKNPTLPIAVKQGERQGDAISKFLETNFVIETNNHKYLKDTITSPTGKTKNPFDVETYFCISNHKERLWIDFKAVNIENIDSNPDSGTPDKIISLIKNGDFYLAYIFVYYQGEEEHLKFATYDNQFVKAYFLKDISSTVRITKVNQLQVNYSQPPTYRTREEFIKFLIDKKKQSFQRSLKKVQTELENLENGIVYKKITLEDLLSANIKQENIIKSL
jgi:hypothetical protein